ISFDFDADPWPRLPPDQRFVQSVAAFAKSLPAQLGALVLILDPAEVTDCAGFGKALAFLAEKAETPWLKYLVFDRKTKPRLEKLEEKSPKTSVQVFSLDPADLEDQVAAELAVNNSLPPAERLRCTAMLASFAFARKDYDTASRLQQSCV